MAHASSHSGLDSARPGMLEGLASGWLALQDLGEDSAREGFPGMIGTCRIRDCSYFQNKSG